jgi:spore coat polysaccharide biosynthesis protein SpsF
MHIGIIIQARLNSTRFPNKVLVRLSDKMVIEEIIDRAKQVQYSSMTVVATSDGKDDDKLVDFLATNTDVVIFRGSEENVLSRYVAVAENLKLDHVVRLTGDNPCIDAKVIDDTIEKHLAGNFDYSYTVGLPLGMNVEIVASSALFAAAKDGQRQADKEHVTFFIRNNPQRFKLNCITFNFPSEIEQLRLTFDTPQDYLMLQILFDYLKVDDAFFDINSIVKLWKSKPYIFFINDAICQKEVFENPQSELKAAAQLLEKQEMLFAAKVVKGSILSKSQALTKNVQ